MAQMAEYEVAGIGGNGNQGAEQGHGTYAGQVPANGSSKFTRKAQGLDFSNIDMDEVARIRREAEEMWS